MASLANPLPVFVPGEPVTSGDRDGPWKAAVAKRLQGWTIQRPALTFVVSSLKRHGQPFDLDNLVHPVLSMMDDPIECVSARLYVGEPVGVLIEDEDPHPPPPDCVRLLEVSPHSMASVRGRAGIAEIVDDLPYADHESVGLALDFDRADIPIRLGWYGPTEAVIDDLSPWLGRYTARNLVADHRVRDLRIRRGLRPEAGGVAISLWYVPDADVGDVREDVRAQIEAASS